MQKTGSSNLLFGLHMHQPVDNLESAVENAVKLCYKPLFEVLAKYPDFKFSLHCSGWLLNHIKERHSKIFDNILALNDAGSVEFFTGGFYEPILASIPPEDRIAQIELFNEYLKTEFGIIPKGLWLTERVWESSIIPQLKHCGIEYVMVDDYHFLASGFDYEELDGYFNTEEGGRKLSLFPISKALRYAIPFYQLDEAVKVIRSKKMAIIFDDAEKFGLWPKTHEWVYKNGWLEQFIEQILQSDIEPIHYKDALTQPPNSIAYLANVSYYEMGEWSLRATDALELEKLKKMVGEEYFEKIGIKFIRGGIWKNFFVKYEESNRLHKRMLGIKEKSDALYRLQTNDVYWHGIFGGLYLPNLRDNAYRYLCECEKQNQDMVIEDLDMDSFLETKAYSGDFVWRFYEKKGGQLIELLDLKNRFNFQNTLTRRFEAYHEEIFHPQKRSLENGIATIHNLPHEVDERIKGELHFDWYTKNSFIDHICNDSLSLKSFKACSFQELGDFANQPARQIEPLIFERKGGIYEERSYPAKLTKRYIPKDEGLDFIIDLQSQSPHLYRYALELNLHFADYDNLLIQNQKLEEGLELLGDTFLIHDPFTDRQIEISFSKEMEALFVPLRTVSQNERGFELMMQGVSMAFIAPFQRDLQIRGSLCLR